jgi:hypothetical protein
VDVLSGAPTVAETVADTDTVAVVTAGVPVLVAGALVATAVFAVVVVDGVGAMAGRRPERPIAGRDTDTAAPTDVAADANDELAAAAGTGAVAFSVVFERVGALSLSLSPNTVVFVAIFEGFDCTVSPVCGERSSLPESA